MRKFVRKYLQQEMPSRQQKSAKKGSERYLKFGPNHILVTLRQNDSRSPVHKSQHSEIVCFLEKVESKFLKVAQKHCVYVSPCQQSDWLLLVQHTLSATNKVNKFLLKKTKKKTTKKNKKKEKNEKKKNLNLENP